MDKQQFSCSLPQLFIGGSKPAVPEFVECNQIVEVDNFVFNSKDGVEDVAELISIPGFTRADFGNFTQNLVEMHHPVAMDAQLMDGTADEIVEFLQWFTQ